MKRTLWIGGCVIGALGALALGARRAESGAADALVRLQATTPGVQQIGNANLNGTFKAGQFQGGGAGLTGVPWSAIVGAPSTLLSLPYSGSGANVGTSVFKVTCIDNGFGLMGVSSPASNTNGVGVYGTSSGSGGKGVIGLATNSAGFTNGVFGQTASSDNNCAGVYGLGPHIGTSGVATGLGGYGLYGESTSDSGYGVYGYNGQPTGFTAGVYGYADSSSGTGVSGAGKSSGVMGTGVGDGAGVRGYSGNGPGVYGQTNGTSGVGVMALTFTSSSSSKAFYAQAPAPALAGLFSGDVQVSGRFVVGTTPNTFRTAAISGPDSDTLVVTNTGGGRGIHVLSNTDTAGWFEAGAGFASIDARNYGAGSTVGVYATVSSGTGTAIWSNGNFVASGTKSFRIDHPLSPENKYLLHYCTEGPVPQNAYNGTVTTDARGEAWVQLPDYFESINKDFRYTLTVVEDTDSDQFVMAKVARKIAAGRFKIRTSAPNVEVCWEVKATRNDRWIQKYGAPVEVDKTANEIGKYQRPELYNLPPSRGVDFRLGANKG